MHPPDELEEYLRGDSALSCQYRREFAPAPPHALDRRVLKAALGDARADALGDARADAWGDARADAPGDAQSRSKPPNLAPLAFAASLLLSVALVLAIAFGPQTGKRDDPARAARAARVVRVAAHADASPNTPLNRRHELYSSDPKLARPPSAWLADIEALRRAGRNSEADAELRRFRGVYPDYAGGAPKSSP